MLTRLKPGLIIISAESEADRAELAQCVTTRAEHVFHLKVHGEKGFALHDLGPREAACREPINIVSTMAEEHLRPIGNLAHTPFALHGRAYASVEGFWQGLKVEAAGERRRIAALFGNVAKRSTSGLPEPEAPASAYPPEKTQHDEPNLRSRWPRRGAARVRTQPADRPPPPRPSDCAGRPEWRIRRCCRRDRRTSLPIGGRPYRVRAPTRIGSGRS